MMYSYYTLSLLKVRCPWKRYLTQAQLLQFTTVLVYTACMAYYHPRNSDLEPKHYWCMIIQSFEMISLFVLFTAFYFKAYQNRAKRKGSKGDDESVPEQDSISTDDSDEGKKQR